MASRATPRSRSPTRRSKSARRRRPSRSAFPTASRPRSSKGSTKGTRSSSARRRGRGLDLRDAFRQSLDDLRQNRLRSALTMFGIAWGIASVVFLVALIAGFAEGEKKSMETLGRELMIFWGGRTGAASGVAKAGKAIQLRYDDIPALSRNPQIKSLSPEIVLWSANLAHLDKSTQSRIHGVAPQFAEI